MFPIKFTTFPSVKHNRPVSAQFKDLQALQDFFQIRIQPEGQDKKDTPCWCPATFKPGTTRQNENVESISFLVYDVEKTSPMCPEPKSPLETFLAFKNKGLFTILHTTWNHTEEAPRYRVAFLLDKPVSAADFQYAWRYGLSLLVKANVPVDTSCKDEARLYIRAACPPGEAGFSAVFPGKPIKAELAVSSGRKVAADPQAKAKPETQGWTLTPDSDIETENGKHKLSELAVGKHKCACPVEPNASMGSAFLRVYESGKAFVKCTSQNHASHAPQEKWAYEPTAAAKGKRTGGLRSVGNRQELIAACPAEILSYVEKNIVFFAQQGVFYRRHHGAWQITTPMRKETLCDHLLGLFKDDGLGFSHAAALVDHVISRQVYGFDCDSRGGPVTLTSRGMPLLNLYAKPTLKIAAQAGPFPRIDQILEVLTSGDKKAREWLTHWAAALIQRPERRGMVSVLVISSLQGIGKSLFGRILSRIVGEGNTAVVSNRALRDSFNASYVNSLLVLADEVGVAGDKDVGSELKSYITDEEVHCAAPYAPRIKVTNRMTWWMTSNERRPLLVESDDRRFTILSCSTADSSYRKMLSQCFTPEGQFEPSFEQEIANFGRFLLDVKVDFSLVAKPYESVARKQLQAASADSTDAFMGLLKKYGARELIDMYPPEGNVFKYDPQNVAIYDKLVPCETLYGSYRSWCVRFGRKDVRQEPVFRLAVLGTFGIQDIKAHVLGGKKIETYPGGVFIVKPVETNNVVKLEA